MSITLASYLEEFITENRRTLLKRVLNNRTRHIALVLEDIHHSQNASAILRTAECFGIQDVHIIEKQNKFEVNPMVVKGATKWLTIKKYKRSETITVEAVKSLKQNGYRIVATSPHTNSCSLTDYKISSEKIALVLGAEKRGVSQEMMDMADDFITIPMYGFTESYNVSVSAAMCLQNLVGKLRESDVSWSLQESEREALYLEWLRKSVRSVSDIEKAYDMRYGAIQ